MANGDMHETNGHDANTKFNSYNTCIRSTGVVPAVIPSKRSFSELNGFYSSGSSGSRSIGEVLDDSDVFGVTETERRRSSRASRGDGAGRRRSAQQKQGRPARRSFELEAADGIHGHGCSRSFVTGARTRQGTGARGRWRRALANALVRDACGRELLPVRSAGDEADEGRGRGECDEGALLLSGLDSTNRRDSRELLLPPKTVTGGKGERRRADGGSGGDGREGHVRAGELLSLAMRWRVCEAAGGATRRRGSRGEGSRWVTSPA
ncbi:hypothetical protein VPH35_044407 [Triticum aestivum]